MVSASNCAVHLLVIGAAQSECRPSILRLDVNVEPYLDLHPIGVFYPDVALGRRHPSGFSRGADVAAMVQIDFNNQPVTIHHLQFNVLHCCMTCAVIEARASLRHSSAHPQRIDGFRTLEG